MKHKDLIDWYSVATNYNILTSEHIRHYFNIVKGVEGEKEFQSWANTYLEFNYLTLRNTWISTGGPRVEIDHLILTPNYWFATEIKNYDNHFYYKNRISRIGNNTIETDIIARAESAHLTLQNIANQLKQPPKVISSIAFINEHCRTYVDYNGQIQILMRCDIRDFLYDVNNKATNSPFYNNPDQIVDLIKSYKTNVSFDIPNYNDLKWNNLRMGVFCPRCSSYNLKDMHSYFSCLICSNREKKQDTIKRVIRDYCILYQKNEFTAKEISEFIDRKISYRTLIRAIKNNYEVSEKYSEKYYQFNSRVD